MKKEIKELYAINSGNFDELKVDLSNIAGIQWDNGHGKGYLTLMITMVLSSKLNYTQTSTMDLTPEISILMQETDSKAARITNPEKKIEKMNHFLTEIFQKNKNNNFHSFLSLILKYDNDTSIIIFLTPTNGNEKILTRFYFQISNNKIEELKEYLKDEILFKKNYAEEVIKQIKLDFKDDVLNFQIEEMNSKKIEMLNPKSIYFLGETDKKIHGNNILLGVSSDTMNSINSLIKNKAYLKVFNNKLMENNDFLDNLNQTSNLLYSYIKEKDLDKKLLEKAEHELEIGIPFSFQSDLYSLNKQYIVFKSLKEKNQKNYFILKKQYNEDKLIQEKLLKEQQEEINKNDELQKKYNSVLTNISYIVAPYKEAIKFFEEKNININIENIQKLINAENSSIAAIKEAAKMEQQINEIQQSIKDKQLKYNHIEEEIKKIEEKINIEKESNLIFDKNSQLSDLNVFLYKFGLSKLKISKNIEKLQLLATDFMKNEDLIDTGLIDEYKEELNQYLEEKTSLELLEENKTKKLLELEKVKKELEELNKKLSELIIFKENQENLTKEERDSKIKELQKNVEEIQNHLFSLQYLNKQNLKNAHKNLENLENDIDNIFNDFEYEINIEDNRNVLLNKLKSLLSKYRENIEELKNKNQELTELNIKIIEELENINKNIEELDNNQNIQEVPKIEEFLQNNKMDFSELVDIEDENILSVKEQLEYEFQELKDKVEIINNLYNNQYRLFSKNKHYEEMFSEINNTSVEKINILVDLKSRIKADLTKQKSEVTQILSQIRGKLENIENITEDLNNLLKITIKKEIDKILNINSKDGKVYSLENENFFEKHYHLKEFEKLRNQIFKAKFYEINDDELTNHLDNANLDDLKEFYNIINKFGFEDNNNSEHRTAVYADKNYFIDFFETELSKLSISPNNTFSTGNKYVGTISLRQNLLNFNEAFKMTVIIDEFGAIDETNIGIYKKVLESPTVFMQNDGFDKVRTLLTHMNQTNKNGNKYINNVIWFDKDVKND